MSVYCTISDIEERTGGNLRQLRLLADAGAIQALPNTHHAGRGVHRLFPHSELDVAAILVALAPFRLPIGTLAEIAASVRGTLLLGGLPAGVGPKRMIDAVRGARAGTSDAFLSIVETKPGDAAPSRAFQLFIGPAPSLPPLPGDGDRRAVAIVVDLRKAWETLR